MRRRLRDRLPLDRETLWWCFWATLAIELVCVVLRFGFGKDSTSATASTIGLLTFGIRIHHGYIGALLVPISLAVYESRETVGRLLFIAGIALFFSDLIHHLLVLWPITGSPDFDLVYPKADG